MKLSGNFIKREIFGEFFLVPIGEVANNVNGLVALNEVSAFIFDCLENECSADDLAKKITEYYDVDFETAKKDAEECVEGLAEIGVVVI